MNVEVLEKGISVASYLEQEKTSEIRHEYHHGNLIPMPGEKKKANIISGNIYEKIRRPLLQQGYHTYFHDVKAAVQPGLIYRYPDVMVAPATDKADEYLIFEPALLVEVASSDSLATDRGVKKNEYTRLPSLIYYIIISQEEMLVELYSRIEDVWTFTFFTEPDEVLDLSRLGISLKLSEVYEFVDFTATE
ncbi:MAG: Uma2 family endonuclease [Saprospiraceae bacterium]